MLRELKSSAPAWELRRALRPFRESADRVAERSFYHRLIPEGRTGCIIDVGANAGGKTEIFRRLAAHVVAIEPDPASARLLRARFRFRPSVTVLQCAISESVGNISFFQFEPGSAYNTANAAWAQSMMDGSNHMGARLAAPKRIEVAATTLGAIAEEFGPAKYIKIDAEGFEQQVISTLRSRSPLISLEFNLPQMQKSLIACVQHLESLGDYVFNAAITEPPHAFAIDGWLTGGELLNHVASRGWLYVELYAQAAGFESANQRPSGPTPDALADRATARQSEAPV
jgi:FkbM family methyltransferase